MPDLQKKRKSSPHLTYVRVSVIPIFTSITSISRTARAKSSAVKKFDDLIWKRFNNHLWWIMILAFFEKDFLKCHTRSFITTKIRFSLFFSVILILNLIIKSQLNGKWIIYNVFETIVMFVQILEFLWVIFL